MQTDAFGVKRRTPALRLARLARIGLDSIRAAGGHVSIIVGAVLLSYGTYFVLDSGTVAAIGEEDGLFENLTAAAFFAASLCFLAAFFRSRNWFLLLLSFVFLVGCGEEISWGQRVFGFKTPDSIAAVNVQEEFNLHNIELLNARRSDGSEKRGLEKLLTVNFLYKLFWLCYGVLLPIVAYSVRPAGLIVSRLHIPLPPLAIGLLFAVNWLTYRLVLSLLPAGETNQFYDTANEAMEWLSSLIFLMISIWFLEESRPSGKTAGPAGVLRKTA
ncbi:MAG: hypothetical protein ACT4PS_03210 [Betaproteobacteria bacterium]